ncbi:hypothetical protein B0H10DRAFT_2427986 [Mycena sp. CBHHK59/15]|nr:hypothetical protein B0H10DRAFT_2427986 [Mycena sp. CBHHK59/15]
MHFFTVLTAILVASASSAYAKCDSGGKAWTSDAESVIRRAAEHFNGAFVLQNISGNDRSIFMAEAYSGFIKEYTGCTYGGDTSYTNWRYVADPNESC